MVDWPDREVFRLGLFVGSWSILMPRDRAEGKAVYREFLVHPRRSKARGWAADAWRYSFMASTGRWYAPGVCFGFPRFTLGDAHAMGKDR